MAIYREHGHALVRGMTMKAILAEMYGKLGGSMHLFDDKLRFFGGNASVGGGIGAVLGGLRPIVEIITVNFSLLALDIDSNDFLTVLIGLSEELGGEIGEADHEQPVSFAEIIGYLSRRLR